MRAKQIEIGGIYVARAYANGRNYQLNPAGEGREAYETFKAVKLS